MKYFKYVGDRIATIVLFLAVISDWAVDYFVGPSPVTAFTVAFYAFIVYHSVCEKLENMK